MTNEQFERLENHLEILQATLIAGFSSLSALVIEAKKEKLDLDSESFNEALSTGMSLVGHMRELLLDEEDGCGCDEADCHCSDEK